MPIPKAAPIRWPTRGRSIASVSTDSGWIARRSPTRSSLASSPPPAMSPSPSARRARGLSVGAAAESRRRLGRLRRACASARARFDTIVGGAACTARAGGIRSAPAATFDGRDRYPVVQRRLRRRRSVRALGGQASADRGRVRVRRARRPRRAQVRVGRRADAGRTLHGQYLSRPFPRRRISGNDGYSGYRAGGFVIRRIDMACTISRETSGNGAAIGIATIITPSSRAPARSRAILAARARAVDPSEPTRRQTRAARRLVPVLQPILRALSGRLARPRRALVGRQSPRISLRAS